MKTIFTTTKLLPYFPENINSYPQETTHFASRESERSIVMLNASNIIITSSNLILKNLKPLNNFLLKRYNGKHVSFTKYLKILFKYLTEKHEKVEGEYLWICTSSDTNYYHWIIDVLVKIMGLRSLFGNIPTILISEEALKVNFIISALEYHNIQYKIINKNTFYHISSIITPITEDRGRLFNVCNLKLAKNQILKDEKENQHTKNGIYISRKNATKRKVINEELLIPLFNKYGIETVYTDNLSYVEQLKLFSQTKLLISIHGAGLVNQIFMPNDSVIIEMRHPNTNKQPLCFFDIARALEYKYYFIMGNPKDPIETPHTANFNLTLSNIQELDDILKKVITHENFA